MTHEDGVDTSQQPTGPLEQQNPTSSSPLSPAKGNGKRVSTLSRMSLQHIATETTTWKSLFNFCTKAHLPILLSAVFFACGSGASVPILAYLVGKIFARFTQFASGLISEEVFKNQISTYNVYIVIVATGTWIFNSIAFFLFHIYGDLQARSARERIFKSLLTRKISWFDRRTDGVPSLCTRILK